MEPGSIVVWSCNTCGAAHEAAGVSTRKPEACESCGGSSFTGLTGKAGGFRFGRFLAKLLRRR